MNKPKHRIPSLDGLRGFSIWAVLAAHIYSHYQTSISRTNHIVHVILADLSYLGVTIFFVISGFLITNILAKSELHLGNFYKRRAIRILPASFIYIAIILVFGHATLLQAVYALTFTTTFAFAHAYTPLQQLWSLSVEECFYLLWPLAMLHGRQSAKRYGWTLMVVAPVLRLILRHYGYLEYSHLAPAVADSLAAGCLFALYREEVLGFARRNLSSGPVCAALTLSTIVIGLVIFNRGLVTLWGIVLLLIVLSISSTIVREDRILNAGPLAWSGLLSYSIYLWQQPFLVMGGPVDFLPLRLALTFIAAYLSYRFIELPALELLARAGKRKNIPAQLEERPILVAGGRENG
jgi:peptidoglycan/LPS O-acetylase OafA/YrhL